MSQSKLLSDAFGRPLKEAGFKKRRGDSWYLENNELILVLNLQKSSYGRQYYVNLAIWLKALGEIEFPPEHKCPIRLRWESTMPGEDKLAENLLNLDDESIPTETRAAEINRLLQEYVFPFFSKVSSLKALRVLYQSNALPKACSVYINAQKLLGKNEKEVNEDIRMGL